MIKLNTKPVVNSKGEFDLALVDGDLIAFAVASAADGHIYRVINPETHELLFEHRYKLKSGGINDWFKNHPEVPKDWLVSDYEPEDIKTVIHSVKQMTSSILNALGATTYRIFLTGSGNFRYGINPEYKANRKNTRKPYHLPNTRKFLMDYWGAEMCSGIEADDACGIFQDANPTEHKKTTVIASIDKDLHCIPGWHYEWSHHGKDPVLKYVSSEEANLNFYRQVLTGDSTDNIFGLHNIGKARANTILKGAKSTSNKDLYECVLRAYERDTNPIRHGFKSSRIIAAKKLLFVAQQIWIFQKDNDIWQAPR